MFKDILDIPLVGNLRLANAFRPHLKASKGCLINIGSMHSYFGSPRVPAYSAAKTAVVSLTKSLARLPKTASASMRSPQAGSRRNYHALSEKTRNSTAESLLAFPVVTCAEAEDLAGAAIFLASPASKLING